MLDGIRRETEALPHGFDVGVGAEVVACDRETDAWRLGQQDLGGVLIRYVRGGLVLVDGHRPAILLSPDDLVVPIRSLHQPDSHRRASLGHERRDLPHVLVHVPEIGLNHDPHVGPVAEALSGRQCRPRDVPSQVSELVLLGIDGDADAAAASRLEDLLQRRPDPLQRAIRVLGPELGRQGGQLQRHLQRGRVPVRALAGEVMVSKAGQQVYVAFPVRLRFLVAQDHLTNEVEARISAFPFEPGHHPFERPGARVDDEAAGYEPRRTLRELRREQTRHPSRRGHLERSAQGEGEPAHAATRVLPDQCRRPRGEVRSREPGKCVDQAQHASPRFWVFHEREHERVLDALDPRTPIGPRAVMQRPPELTRSRLDNISGG